MNDLKSLDKKVFDIIKNEEKRQKEDINLIPSENYVSKAVREASSSVFTNKYSEGYPNRRYYAGNKWVDKIKDLAKNDRIINTLKDSIHNFRKENIGMFSKSLSEPISNIINCLDAIQ